MDSTALKLLHQIVGMEGIDRKSGTEARKKALNQWINDYIAEVNTSQAVIKKGLTLEDEEFIKYYLSYKIGDELMNECIYVENNGSNISTKVYAIRR